ncbi:MAG: KH domain-containing protein [Candidatus Gracilibacteria bacterium]|nr:KH domain-containing protein [Candidatus Gracilibacteria bacterium]
MKEVEFLKFVIESIVTHKNDIEIERKEDEFGILLTLKVNKEDMPYVIGKGGNIVTSVRSLLRVLGLKLGYKINLKVLD